jgi:hypothetical protein
VPLRVINQILNPYKTIVNEEGEKKKYDDNNGARKVIS